MDDPGSSFGAVLEVRLPFTGGGECSVGVGSSAEALPAGVRLAATVVASVDLSPLGPGILLASGERLPLLSQPEGPWDFATPPFSAGEKVVSVDLVRLNLSGLELE